MQPQPGKQLPVDLDVGIAGRQELVAVEDRIRSREEAQRLDAVAQLAPARGEPHHRPRHRDSRDGDGAHELERVDRFGAIQRRAFDLYQVIDRHRLGIRIEVGELRDQARALRARFPHADDPAAADMEPGVANALERFQTIAIGARGDDLAVELGRRVEVVVVVIESGFLQRLRLAIFKHAQRGAGFESQRFDFAHHGQHRLEIAVLRTAPRRAHAEARRARGLRRGGDGGDLADGKNRFVRHAGVIARSLRAVRTILGTPPGLDRQQRRELHRVGFMVRCVHLVRAREQIVERQREQPLDRRERPARKPGTGAFRGGGRRRSKQWLQGSRWSG